MAKNITNAVRIWFCNILIFESRRMRWAGHAACMGRRRSIYGVLVEKPEGKRPLGIPRSRWEDNIKMDLQEAVWGAWMYFLA